MADGIEVNLAKFRLEQAHDCLNMSEIAMNSSLRTSVNRYQKLNNSMITQKSFWRLSRII